MWGWVQFWVLMIHMSNVNFSQFLFCLLDLRDQPDARAYQNRVCIYRVSKLFYHNTICSNQVGRFCFIISSIRKKKQTKKTCNIQREKKRVTKFSSSAHNITQA